MNRQVFADLVADVLDRAREILSDPARWTQGEFARDAQGNALALVDVDTDYAVCFCTLGALHKAAKSLPVSCHDQSSARRAARGCVQRMLEDQGVRPHITHFNDRATHAEVLSVLEGAKSYIPEASEEYYA